MERDILGIDDILPIAAIDNKGTLPTIVAGMAVNFYAEMYSDRDEKLKALTPFTTKDLDLWGHIGTLEALTRHYGVPATMAPPRVPVLGIIMIPRGGGPPIKVELLRSVNGLNRQEQEDVCLFRIKDNSVQVLSPIMCLKAKLSNAAELDQTDRQDVKHVKIMAICSREYLVDLLTGRFPTRFEKDILHTLHQMNDVISSNDAKTVKTKWNIDLNNVMPMSELRQNTSLKVQNFVRFQIDKDITSRLSDGGRD